jgi:hypothetical protein
VSHVPDRIAQLWRSLGTPSPDELRELARRASGEPQLAEAPAPRRRRLRARWAVAIGAVALLLGSGLGFSLGSSVTPSGSAGRNVVGFGFLPGRGWDVVQTGGSNPGTTNAVASKDGTVISVTSKPRGDPAEDVHYDLRELPLQVADARRSPGDPFRLELRAGVGGYNIDATVTFAAPQPTPRMLAATQQQLDRLVVAAGRVTIAVRPAIGSRLTSQVTVFGTIDSGGAGESVTVQAKECDNSFFRVFAGASTEAGGTWSTLIFPNITMTLRAVWNGETSNEVTFRRRAWIQLYRLAGSATRFRMYVGPRFAGKSVSIQRFDQRLGRWESIRRVPAHGTSEGTRFTLRTPKGTRIRAVLPTSQARPCYLSGTSPVIRT